MGDKLIVTETMLASFVWYMLLSVVMPTASSFLFNGLASRAVTKSPTTTRNPSSWSPWSTWSDCSASCGPGSRFRARHCEGGSDCIGDVFQQSSCDNHCIVPVDGFWSHWSAWASCSKTCGEGTHSRYRQCNNPAPADGGKSCPGNTASTQTCKDKECPIDGGWSSFQARPCTATCGTGVLVSVRQCNNPKPQYGGNNCVGDFTKFDKCSNDLCIVDGVWSEWSGYTNCTVVCGEGYQRRSRECNNPPPAAGGADCTGIDDEKKICSSGTCPKDIRVCDRTVITTTTCSNDPITDGIALIKTHCHFPNDVSDWYLGLEIAENCEMLPLYTSVGSLDENNFMKYGVMLDCFNNTMEILSRSCDNHESTETLNLTNNKLHVLTHH